MQCFYLNALASGDVWIIIQPFFRRLEPQAAAVSRRSRRRRSNNRRRKRSSRRTVKMRWRRRSRWWRHGGGRRNVERVTPVRSSESTQMDQITNTHHGPTHSDWKTHTQHSPDVTMYSKLLQFCSINLKISTIKIKQEVSSTLIFTHPHTHGEMCPCATHMQSVKASCEAGSRFEHQSVVCVCCVFFFFEIAATLRPQTCVIYSLFTSGAAQRFTQQIKTSVTAIKS